MSKLFLLALAFTGSHAWTTGSPKPQQQNVEMSRRQALLQSLVGGAALATAATTTLSPLAALAVDSGTLPNGVQVQVKKSGSGAQPIVGDLVAIRFAAYYGDIVIDDIFGTPEPYYTRVGSGALVKGVEETIPLMKVGDRWVLTIPGELAFGKDGRPASPGKPRIPPNAVITFDLEMVGLPGKEPELIELIGDV